MLITVSGSLKKTVATQSVFWVDKNPHVAHDAGNLLAELCILTDINAKPLKSLENYHIKLFITQVQFFIKHADKVSKNAQSLHITLDHLKVMLDVFSAITVGVDSFYEPNIGDVIKSFVEFKVKITCSHFKPRLDVTDVNSLELTQFSNPIQRLILRFIFEAITNASKYSKAKNVVFKKHQNEDQIKVIYEDDGVGFTYRSNGGVCIKSESGKGLNHLEKTAHYYDCTITKRNNGQENGGGITLELSIPNKYINHDQFKNGSNTGVATEQTLVSSGCCCLS